MYFSSKIKTAISDKSMIFEINHLCFDLGEPLDFTFMEYLMIN